MIPPLSVREAAARLGVSPTLVYALCAAGKLRHSRVGLGRGKIVIPPAAVEEYLRAREVAPAPQAPPPPRGRPEFRHLSVH